MKLRSTQLHRALLPLVKAGAPHIFKHQHPGFSVAGNKQLEQALHDVRNLIGAAMRAALQLHSVYEDTVVCYKMIGTFPWKTHRITRAQHLRFVWSQFTNNCYRFEERYKLFMTLQHRTMTIFKKKKIGSVANGIKRIRNVLGWHIRQRGQDTHEWSASNPQAEHFATIEFINSIEPQNGGPLGNVAGQFKNVRMLMRWEIEMAVKFME